jgi:small GTP-binding protein
MEPEITVESSASNDSTVYNSEKRMPKEEVVRMANSLIQKQSDISSCMIDLNNDTENPKRNKLSELDYNSANFFRVALIGDSGVGKTSIVQCCRDGISELDPLPTIGVDYIIKHYMLEKKSKRKSKNKYDINPSLGINNTSYNICDDKLNQTLMSNIIKLSIWDTAGQERFTTIITSYFRSADAVIVVYDVSSIESFNNVTKWIDLVKKSSLIDGGPEFYIIGNKIDLVDHFQQNVDYFIDVSTKNNWHHTFISAQQYEKVDVLFKLIAFKLLENEQDKENKQLDKVKSNSINLNLSHKDKKNESQSWFSLENCCWKD